MKYIISLIIRKVPRKYLQKVSHIGLRILAIFYAGNNVLDPISGKTYRKFLPYGRINPRENALSPGSLSLERHRLMWLYLKEKTNFFSAPLKVLHIAPEYCFLKLFDAMKNLDYITADIESPLAKVKMDVHNIPFETDTFDVCFCNHVMEHVESDIKAMREIHRVLKPGGWAIIQSPIDYTLEKSFEDPSITDPTERERVYGQNDHVRQYGRDYKEHLERAGFIVTEDDYVMQMPPEEVKKYGLDPQEFVYFCRK